MQKYLSSKYLIAIASFVLIAFNQLVSAQKSREQEVRSHRARYIPLKWIGDRWGLVLLDPQLRYLSKIDADGMQIWRCAEDFKTSELVYDNLHPKHNDAYEVERGRAIATRDGFAFVAAYAHPATNEPSMRLVLWDFNGAQLNEIQKRDEFSLYIITNPDGTKLAQLVRRIKGENLFKDANRHSAPEDVETGYEIRDLNTGRANLINLFHEGTLNIAYAVGMDKKDTIYDVVEKIVKQGVLKQTNLVLRIVKSGDQECQIISPQNAPLLTNIKDVAEPQKPVPLLLDDGMTVATYARDANDQNQYSIQYYRDGKYVKSLNDPVPKGTPEARLIITSDGKCVVTQIVDGEKKGLVKIWDIKTGRSSEVTTLPPIRYVFPWVQGKYAPIWTCSDGHTYEGGMLEIIRASD